MRMPLPPLPMGLPLCLWGMAPPTAKVSYSQMQTAMQTLGYENVFIRHCGGRAGGYRLRAVIEAVKAAGTRIVLRPLMVNLPVTTPTTTWPVRTRIRG